MDMRREEDVTGEAQRLWREENALLKEERRWLQIKTLPADEFNVIKLLGRGFYGPVRLVKNNSSGNLYAMKTVNRLRGPEDLMVIRLLNQERLLLTEVCSVWVERLFHSFQDSHSYFLLLEYIPSGSLAELLEQEGSLLEYQGKFYGAEMLMAINIIHRYGFMHRNIQLSNFLLDQFGHIKIVDFGTSLRFLPVEICEKMSSEPSFKDGNPYISAERRDRIQIYQRKTTSTCVGPMAFMAPEVVRPRPRGFLAQVRPAAKGTEYSFACDFWSFGVCMYNLLIGELPFQGESRDELSHKIINWRQSLAFPMVQPISDEAKDLIKRLLRDEPYRLGVTACEDVMSHTFFDSIDWPKLRNLPVSVPIRLKTPDGFWNERRPPAYIRQLLKSEGDCGAHNRGSKEDSNPNLPDAYHQDFLVKCSEQDVAGSAQCQSSHFPVPSVSIQHFPGQMLTPSESRVDNSGAVDLHENDSVQRGDYSSLLQVSGEHAPHPVDFDSIRTWLDGVEVSILSGSSTDHSPLRASGSVALENLVLRTMTSQDLSRLSKQKEEMERNTNKEEKKRLNCVLM